MKIKMWSVPGPSTSVGSGVFRTPEGHWRALWGDFKYHPDTGWYEQHEVEIQEAIRLLAETHVDADSRPDWVCRQEAVEEAAYWVRKYCTPCDEQGVQILATADAIERAWEHLPGHDFNAASSWAVARGMIGAPLTGEAWDEVLNLVRP